MNLVEHEHRLAQGVTAAKRAVLRADAGFLPMGDFELRDGSGADPKALTFTGYASVTERDYNVTDWLGEYTETVRRGAFRTTLGQNPDVAFLINHGGMTMARTRSGTLKLAEDSTGLHVDARLDPVNPDVIGLRSAIERGDIDEMSFAFRVTRQQWSPDYDQRDILEVDLNGGDVSAVNKGANPATGGLLGIRSIIAPKTLTALTAAVATGRPLSAAQRAAATRLVDVAYADLSEAAVTALLALDDEAMATQERSYAGPADPAPGWPPEVVLRALAEDQQLLDAYFTDAG